MGSTMSNSDRTEGWDGNVNLEQTAAEVENENENPIETNGYGFGKGVDSGNSPAFTESVPVTEGVCLEACGPPSSVTNVEVLKSSGVNNVNDLALNHVDRSNTKSEAVHVITKVQDGL
nr:hypothetical protein CFP56_05358 [Quercus suber]